MSDKMTPIPFEKLLNRCIEELRYEKSIFGVPQTSFWKAKQGPVARMFGRALENVCGPAAGPHTQLAQNIVAAYVCGARFFELKTVQKLDGEDLPVSKPCIWAKDETFNVEWSTELLVSQAMDEYIKAWFLLHVLSAELELGAADGFIFNMSVGYDLAGIQLPKIDSFIEGLKDASKTAIFAEVRTTLLRAADSGLFRHADKAFINAIPAQVCSSVTLSTLHGCPPGEIERIASYLIAEKELHTFIKCNPTLLGYTEARGTLDKLGFTNLTFDEHHFIHDLQLADAVPLIERMKKLAAQKGKTFGVKLTNTFPVEITNNELPGEEMYMSGKSLYPLSLLTAQKLSKAFGGKLRISFSGGADALNITQLCETGMYPITLATSVLKPGGYERFNQVASLCCAEKIARRDEDGAINADKLDSLCGQLLEEKRNFRALKSSPRLKIRKKVPLTDCFAASCKNTCPIGQDIPEYIAAAAEGRYADALGIITAKNPLPFITGTICNHRCTSSCARHDYDEAVTIREIKLLCAEKALPEFIKNARPAQVLAKARVAVVGAGPAGLAAAYFLARAGISVTVFDRQKKAGGVVRSIIPPFRIPSASIDRDVEWVAAQGVEFRLGKTVSATDLAGFDHTVLAIGAWQAGVLELDADREPLKCFEFLSAFSQNPANLHLGQSVVVIGAGNSSMDACRAALRVPGVKKVTIVYRRTKEQMPADAEEFAEALKEGALFMELLAPVSHKNGLLSCEICELGAPDASGRRSPVKTGKKLTIPADTIISAVGEKVDGTVLADFGVTCENGKPCVQSSTLETNAKNVFVAGDARRGPATIVEAIADAQKAASAIIGRIHGAEAAEPGMEGFADIETAFKRAAGQNRGVLKAAAKDGKQEPERCFTCNLRCGVCAEVCPNRANMVITAAGRPQIIHLDALCNECGNCEAFCPYESAPYLEKFTFFSTEADFTASTNAGFVFTANSSVRVRIGEKEETFARNAPVPDSLCGNGAFDAGALSAIISAVETRYGYVL